MGQELADIDADEVAIVKRGAIGRRFSFLKSADDRLELAKAVADALNDPIDGEASLIDVLRKAGVDDDAQEGLVAAARILKGFEGELPEQFRIDFASLLKADAGADDACDEEMVEKCATRTDLEAALAKAGESPAEDIKQQLIAKAAELDANDALPKDWVSKSNATKEHTMADGLSVPVRKDDGTWDTSGVEDPAARAFYDTVLKSLDETKDANTALGERVEKAETEASDLRSQLAEREILAKAEKDFSHVAKADELAPILKAAKDSLDAETFEKLEGVLKTANARLETGELFAELGKSGDAAVQTAIRNGATLANSGGSAWEKIEGLAKSVVEKSDGAEPLTSAQAIARVLKTDEGRALYRDYMLETTGGVR